MRPKGRPEGESGPKRVSAKGSPASAALAVRPRAVVFDMDGLMLDTEPLAARAWLVAARQVGVGFDAAVNPTLVEGKKTGGLEIAEQCGDEVPDWVAVSVGDGCTIAGIGKGLAEMKALGFIPRVPRLLGVQAQGARPLVDAFAAGRDLVPGPAETLADSICVGHPRNWRPPTVTAPGTPY